MKKYLVLIPFLLACGDTGATGPQGPAGISLTCSVSSLPEGALITCPDGSTAVILNGKDCHGKDKD
jgi:hypothetical protein